MLDTTFVESTMSVDTTAVSTITWDTTKPDMPADSLYHTKEDPPVTGSLYSQKRYRWQRAQGVYNDPAPPDLFMPGALGTHTFNQSCHLAADAPPGSNALALVQFSGSKYSVDKRNGGANTGTAPPSQATESVHGSQSFDRQTIDFSVGILLRTKASVAVWQAGVAASASAGTAHADTVSLVMTDPAPAP